MKSSELGRIEILTRMFGGASEGRVILGIGDDAAVLAPGSEPLVWTVDAAVEGVHFRRALLSLGDLGYRSTMAAASDLAAMGAEPMGVLAALVLPDDVDDADLEALARGQLEAVTALGTVVVGGNLARGGELSITTTVLGRAPAPLLRRGARPGDTLWLSGPVGLAAAGLRFLTAAGPLVADAAALACVEAWRRPRARLAEGLALRGVARAAIDVSDGLARDVGHLARAAGVRAVIEVAAVISERLRAAAAELGVSAADLALFGGEDYAIACAVPAGTSLTGAVEVGWFEASESGAGEVVAVHADGSREPLRDRGFDHFAR
jgi:thiamine-monophosphate kinase